MIDEKEKELFRKYKLPTYQEFIKNEAILKQQLKEMQDERNSRFKKLQEETQLKYSAKTSKSKRNISG